MLSIHISLSCGIILLLDTWIVNRMAKTWQANGLVGDKLSSNGDKLGSNGDNLGTVVENLELIGEKTF